MIQTETFVSLINDSLIKHWDLPAFTNYESETLSYKQVADSILKLHKIFHEYGLSKGDKVALIGRNQNNWGIVYLASISYGAVIVPILPDFSTSDIHHIVNHSDSRLLFITDRLYDKVDETKMPHIKAIISLEDYHLFFPNKKEHHVDVQQIMASDPLVSAPNEYALPQVALDEIAVISYTSGTSGFSKGVILPHKSLWNNARIVWDADVDLKTGYNIVSFLPLAHAYGCLFEFITPFINGCHITFLTRTPSPQIITKAFREIKPNLILAVPLIIEKIYKRQILPALDKKTIKLGLKVPVVNNQIFKKINQKLSHVFGGEFTEIIIGGAAFNKEVEQFLKQIGFKFTVGYGMTECGPLISYRNWKHHKQGSAGRVVPGMNVRIDSKDPHTIPGEIQVKGDNVMQGYYKNEIATKEAFTDDGWLKTGDLGIIDTEDHIFIMGRSKNMILGASGQNIYPEEIEARINNLPYIMESLVRENNGKLEALAHPDFEKADADGLNIQQIEKIITEQRDALNQSLPNYMNISKISLFPSEFEKTPKRSIKRYLYTLDNNQ